jgi:hypothetical protein
MLEKEDICTDETLHALEAIGFKRTEYSVSIYEAYKFLRRAYNTHIEPYKQIIVPILLGSLEQDKQYRVRLIINMEGVEHLPLTHTLSDDDGKHRFFDTYEDALQAGILSCCKTIDYIIKNNMRLL